jgi:2-polyprenyl-3-methyl-5-hydroxy-6-metoxy-1,4-benzoquinol methylase
MSGGAKKLYEEHHKERRSPGFSVLKEERGRLFSSIIGTGKRVLDLGCRDGALTAYVVDGNSVLGVDVDEVALTRAHETLGIETRVLDAHGDWNELGEETFDAVLMGEVLEHLFYPDRVVAQVAAHLRRGGVFVGSVPNAFSLKNRLRYFSGSKKNTPLEDPTHINQFSAADLESILRTCFSSIEIRGLGRYSRLAAALPSWFAFDLVFIARKS